MNPWTAEVISIGDEIVSGQRLDTNTQWLSQALGKIGIEVRFQSSVGDDLNDHIAVIKQALGRAEIVVMTGGLGPTADDLTRQAVAAAVNVDLVMHPSELERIEAIFRHTGRAMPPSNQLQAYFPAGATVIPNPEGTAGGIDLLIDRTAATQPNPSVSRDTNDNALVAADGRGNSPTPTPTRLIALPGVPIEMKQMWELTVEQRLRDHTQTDSVFHYHTLHCFGAGESSIEAMLPKLIERGRDPKVGVTASRSTISLRISTRGQSIADCQTKMLPTLISIRENLGDLIFGESDQTLGDVIATKLMLRKQNVCLFDAGLIGEVKRQLGDRPSLIHEIQLEFDENSTTNYLSFATQELAEKIRQQSGASFGLVISPMRSEMLNDQTSSTFFDVAIATQNGIDFMKHHYWGHSEWRNERAGKSVLNQFRLLLQRLASDNTNIRHNHNHQAPYPTSDS